MYTIIEKYMKIPTNLLYTQDHEWVKIENNIVYIGITDFAQGELGDIVYVEIETTGEKLKQHDIFGSVEAVKTVSDLFLPLSGEILELNPNIELNPELVNSDPYGEGWMIKLEIENSKEIEALLTPDSYASLISLL